MVDHSSDERQIIELMLATVKPQPGFLVDETPNRHPFRCEPPGCVVDPALWQAFDTASHQAPLPSLPPQLEGRRAPSATLHDGYPGGPPAVALSPIAFSGQRALVSVSYTCGSMCGVFLACVLEHDASGWHIAQTLVKAVS